MSRKLLLEVEDRCPIAGNANARHCVNEVHRSQRREQSWHRYWRNRCPESEELQPGVWPQLCVKAGWKGRGHTDKGLSDSKPFMPAPVNIMAALFYWNSHAEVLSDVLLAADKHKVALLCCWRCWTSAAFDCVDHEILLHRNYAVLVSVG